MPYFHTTVTTKLDDEKRENLSKVFRSLCSTYLEKPEAFVMTSFNDGTAMSFQATTEPTANIKVEVLGGFPPGAPAKMTPLITAAIEKECGVKADRMFIMYSTVQDVGWNGSNF